MSAASRENLVLRFEEEDRFEALCDFNPSCCGLSEADQERIAARSMGIRVRSVRSYPRDPEPDQDVIFNNHMDRIAHNLTGMP